VASGRAWEGASVADQHWVRVVGYLQPPPAREVFYTPAYYRGGNGHAPSAVPKEITTGDRLIYFALGPFSLFAVGTVTGSPQPLPDDPSRRAVDVKTDVFISTVMKTPHLGGVILPSGRNLNLLVEQYGYIWLSSEDGAALVERVQTKAGAKD
jgi:hypothetical protein